MARTCCICKNEKIITTLYSHNSGWKGMILRYLPFLDKTVTETGIFWPVKSYCIEHAPKTKNITWESAYESWKRVTSFDFSSNRRK